MEAPRTHLRNHSFVAVGGNSSARYSVPIGQPCCCECSQSTIIEKSFRALWLYTSHQYCEGLNEQFFFLAAFNRGPGSASCDASGAIQFATCRSIFRFSGGHKEGRTSSRTD